MIEDEPRDLLGPVHQRLAMHCLSEVDSSNKTLTAIPLRQNLEEQLSRWVFFECKSSGTATLAGDMQFPESVLEAIIQGCSEDQRSSLMHSLLARRTSLTRYMRFITTWLREGVSPDTMAIICKGFNENSQHLPDETLNALVGRMADEHYSIRCSALWVLGRQRTLPEGILKDMVKRLEDIDSRVRKAAVIALGDRLDPDAEVFKALLVRAMNFKDPNLDQICEPFLGIQSTSPRDLVANFPEGFIEKTLSRGLLGAESDTTLQKRFVEETLPEEFRKVVGKLPLLKECLEVDFPKEFGKALAKPPLSEDILAAVAKRLDDKKIKVRKAAANSLGAHSILPKDILERVARQLDDKSKTVREAAVRTLGAQSILPGKILEAVAKRLGDKDSNVREVTIYALGSQYQLPREILESVTKRLDDTESNVRQAVATILGFQPNAIRVNILLLFAREFGEEFDSKIFSSLPDDLLASIMAELDDEDSHVKEAIRSAWTYQSTLPVEILRTMAEKLNDEDNQVRDAITSALIRQSYLPEEIVTTVAALLKDRDIEVKDAAARILEKQSILSEEIGQALAVVMDDRKAREETNYTGTSSNTEDEFSSLPLFTWIRDVPGSYTPSTILLNTW